MCFLISFIPATAWFILGYFVFFASTKAEGDVQTFGKFLAIWVFILASFVPVMGAYVTLSGFCPLEAIMETMHSGPAP